MDPLILEMSGVIWRVSDSIFSFVIAGLHQPLVGILRKPNSRDGAVTKQQCTRRHSHGNYPGVRQGQQQHHSNHNQQPISSGHSSHHSNQGSKVLPWQEAHYASRQNGNPYVADGYQNKNSSHGVHVPQRHKQLGSQNKEPTNYSQIYPVSSSRLTESSHRHLDDSGYYGHQVHSNKGGMPNSDGYNSLKSRASANTDDMYTDNASSTSGSYILDNKDLQDLNELSSIQAVVV